MACFSCFAQRCGRDGRIVRGAYDEAQAWELCIQRLQKFKERELHLQEQEEGRGSLL